MVLYTWTDLEQRVIFDRMLIPFAVIGAHLDPAARPRADGPSDGGGCGRRRFPRAGGAGRRRIGGGDIKLVAALGLWLGSDMLMTVVIAGIVLGGMAALIMLATGKRKKGRLLRLRALLHDQCAVVYAAVSKMLLARGPGDVFRLRRSAE